MNRTKVFSIRFEPQEYKTLDNLARETGRSKGGVVRRLIKLAELPEAKRLLGTEPNPQAAQSCKT